MKPPKIWCESSASNICSQLPREKERRMRKETFLYSEKHVAFSPATNWGHLKPDSVVSRLAPIIFHSDTNSPCSVPLHFNLNFYCPIENIVLFQFFKKERGKRKKRSRDKAVNSERWQKMKKKSLRKKLSWF